MARAQNLLPLGLAEGCLLKRGIPKDQVLTYDDVEVPADRLCGRLRIPNTMSYKKLQQIRQQARETKAS